MSEAEIRSFFARLEAVREHWSSEVGATYGEYFRYLPGTHEVEVLYTSEDYYRDISSVSRFYIPVLAFSDFAAAAAPILEKQRQFEARKRREQEEYRRAQYERLKAEFGSSS